MEKVICDKCKWSWETEKSDNNPYLCHKCGYDNKLKKYDLLSFNKWKKENQPYKEEVNDGYLTRTFSEDIDSDELVWHRDRQDRIVEVVSDSNWYIQYDNKLPNKMNKGDKFTIPKNTYHRIIKKSGELKVNIYFT